jgi:hypothetical protein
LKPWAFRPAPRSPSKHGVTNWSFAPRSSILAENHVSSRRTATGLRPIIDVANQAYLGLLADFPELKVTGWHERLQVTPTRRAAAILRSRRLTPPFRVLEVFAGGGTLTAAVAGNEAFAISAGIQIEPRFADIWQAEHPGAALIQADIRAIETSDLPEFDILIGGIPCTSHSTLGRAKKGLGGKPELGDTGDLFLPVIGIIRERMPAAILFENVPSFDTSLAGQLLTTHLERLGYHIFTTVLNPNEEWNEIEDRKRWILVATLDRPFDLQAPGIPNTTPVSAFLDPPDPERDTADARRIAATIAGLRRHQDRHQAVVAAGGVVFGFIQQWVSGRVQNVFDPIEVAVEFEVKSCCRAEWSVDREPRRNLRADDGSLRGCCGQRFMVLNVILDVVAQLFPLRVEIRVVKIQEKFALFHPLPGNRIRRKDRVQNWATICLKSQ